MSASAFTPSWNTTTSVSSSGIPITLDPSHYTLIWSVKIVIAVLYIAAVPCGIFGNILVILAILLTKLRTRVPNILVLNLAITDISVSAIPMPVFGAYYIFHWPQWQFGIPLCKLALYIMRVCGTMSVFTLIVIAIDRYFAVVRGKRFAGRRNMIIILLVLWLACSVVMIYTITGDGLEKRDLGGKTFEVCQKMDGENITEDSYFYILIVQTGASVFIIFFIFGAYLSMIVVIWRSKRLAKKVAHSTVLGKRQNTKAIKLMFAILIAFLLTWVPYFFITLVRLFPPDPAKGINPSIILLLYSLAITNSGWNPVLYALVSETFKSAYGYVMHGGCRAQTAGTIPGVNSLDLRLRAATGLNTPTGSPLVFRRNLAQGGNTPNKNSQENLSPKSNGYMETLTV